MGTYWLSLGIQISPLIISLQMESVYSSTCIQERQRALGLSFSIMASNQAVGYLFISSINNFITNQHNHPYHHYQYLEHTNMNPKQLWAFIGGVVISAAVFKLVTKPVLPQGFVYITDVDPTITIVPRYYYSDNFVGKNIAGYLKPTIILTKEAAYALKQVQERMREMGLSLVIYDAYRPQKAVNDFFHFFQLPEDNNTKPIYYPYLDKQELFDKGYVAKKSGHTRGSTVDLTIIKRGKDLYPIPLYQKYTLKDGRTILIRDDGTERMCGHFDLLDEASHHDTSLVDAECLSSRDLLRRVMGKSGFRPLHEEWWHYTLINEPFPDTYFDFDVE